MALAGTRPEEIAPGGYRVETGLTEANAYLVRSGPAWVLIDAAWPHRGQLIKSAAESLSGSTPAPVFRAFPAGSAYPHLVTRPGTSRSSVVGTGC